MTRSTSTADADELALYIIIYFKRMSDPEIRTIIRGPPDKLKDGSVRVPTVRQIWRIFRWNFVLYGHLTFELRNHFLHSMALRCS